MNNVLIGLNIRQSRKEKKLTQKQLAEKIGRVESSIRKYEKGEVEVPSSVLEQIANVLDTTLGNLMGISSPYEKVSEKSNAFYKLLLSMQYSIIIDDPEHKPFLKTPNFEVYALEYEDLQKLMDVSEAYIKYTLNELLKNRQKIK